MAKDRDLKADRDSGASVKGPGERGTADWGVVGVGCGGTFSTCRRFGTLKTCRHEHGRRSC